MRQLAAVDVLPASDFGESRFQLFMLAVSKVESGTFRDQYRDRRPLFELSISGVDLAVDHASGHYFHVNSVTRGGGPTA